MRDVSGVEQLSSQLNEKALQSNHTWTFFANFLNNTRTIGSVIPSSNSLAEHIVRDAGVVNAETVVEFGPGTGVITGHILNVLQPDSKFLTLEVNPDFVRVLRRRFPGVKVEEDSAHNARKHLETMGADSCDVVVSGLPWASFSDRLQDELLDVSVDILRPGGVFVTYSYYISSITPGAKRFREKLSRWFPQVRRSRPIWKNVPPAYAYWAQK
jgi:phosphatidylethanolamine/phosphatidyl-N-methylethanolamine N-methyltransferase